MMMMTIGSLQKVARSRCRKLHTIISRETITPSSPTPSHLQTYNLSLLDQYSHHLYVPVIFFYPNHSTSYNKVHHLKKSLSQTLNQYYPFAGRFPTLTESYMNCNDDGVTFLETFNDSEMDDVIAVLELDKTVRSQLLADGLEWGNTGNNLSPLAVQFTNFACGGTAVAVSMSHRIGDACTLGTFLNHWATLVRNNAADHQQQHAHVINPHYISSPRSDFTIQPAHLFVNDCERVVKNFIFRNSKLQELKNKVSAMAEKAGTPLKSPTRVEVLTSLLYKAGVAADTTRCGGFSGPSYLFSAVDMRQKMMEKLPETTVGNIVTNFVTFTKNPSETALHAIVADMQKSKSVLQQVHNLQEVFENRRTLQSNMETIDLDYVAKKSFGTSSITRFPFKKIDFGWGKPAHAIMPMGSVQGNGILLTEARDGDGIEVTVTLETPLMSIFQSDKDLLAFSSDT